MEFVFIVCGIIYVFVGIGCESADEHTEWSAVAEWDAALRRGAFRISAAGISNFTIIKVTKTYNFLLTGQHLGHIAILLTFLALSGQHFGHIAVLLTFLVFPGQHFKHIAVLLTFSALASQHFAHLVVLLTFLAPSGQHFKYIAVLLTFLAPSGQHLVHMAVLLTFSSLASQNLIYRIQQYRLLAIGIIFYPAALST